MSQVSARLSDLRLFVTRARTNARSLEDGASGRRTTYRSFASGAGSQVGDDSNVLVAATVDGIIGELRELADFVELVADALELSDAYDGGEYVTADVAVVDELMRDLANERGVSFDETTSVDEVLAVALPEVGTVPADSGWVSDPVATATGHFIVTERDMPMPARLNVLEWQRTYASTASTDDVGLGGGWFSWLNARLRRVGDALTVIDQHGRELTLSPGPASSGRPGGTQSDVTRTYHSDDRSVAAVEAAHGSITVRWGRRSDRPFEHWSFDDVGRLIDVSAEVLGSTRFRYDGERLVALEHDGGRRLDLHWAGNDLASIVSSDGRSAVYDHVDGRLTAVRAPGSIQSYRYDEAGRVSALIDADDVVIVELEYDEAGRVISQTENTGGRTRFEYPGGRRTFVNGGDDVRRAGYLHDDHGRVVVATGAPLHAITRQFDGFGRTVHQTNLDGTQFEMSVEDIGNDDGDNDAGTREVIRHSHGSVEVFDYDALDRLTGQMRDGSGLTYEYLGRSVMPVRVHSRHGWFVDLEWSDGNLTSVVDADGVTSKFEYDADGNLVAAIDGLGHRTEYGCHASGVRRSTVHPDGSEEHCELDAAGRVLRFVDAEGAQTTCDLSPAGRLRSITEPTRHVLRFVHDQRGNLTATIDAAGHRCDWEVDDDGRPATVTLPDGSARSIERDLAGRIVAVIATDAHSSEPRSWRVDRSVTDTVRTIATPAGRSTTLTEVAGRLSEVIRHQDDAESSWRFDRLDREQIITDESGTTWSSTLDESGRVVTCLSADGDVTTYRYTPAGRLWSIDGDDRTTRLEYDAAGQIVRRDDGAGWWTFDRDPRGRVVRVGSPMGREQWFEYDSVGRVIANVLGEARTVHGYDAAGRLVRTSHPDRREISYAYGPRGELTEVRDAAGGLTQYRYDDRRRLIELIDPGGASTQIGYATDHRPARVTDPMGRTRTFRYDLDGVMTEMIDGEGTTAFEHDAHGRLVSTVRIDGSGTNDTTRIERDLTGRVTALVRNGVRAPVPSDRVVVDEPGTPGAPAGLSTLLDLDGLGLAVRTDGFTRDVRRDDVGRRIETVDRLDGEEYRRRVERDPSGSVVAADLDGQRRVFRYHESGFLAAAIDEESTSSWLYDDLGRLIVEDGPLGRRRFAYDNAHQLVEVTEFGRATRFEYDAIGRRTKASGAQAVRYEWDALGLTAVISSRGRTELIRNPFGLVDRIVTPDGHVTEIEWDSAAAFPLPTRIGDLATITDGATVVALRNADGAAVRIPDLVGSWGEIQSQPGQVDWHPFHGLHVDGLVVLGHRVYDVATRQFLSPDPKQATIGMASAGWTYCYAANDPVNRLDPLGLSPLSNEEFERIKDRYTGPQWGNIAQVAIVVVAIVLTPTGAGPMVLVAAGAATGFASEAGGQVINNLTNTGDQGFDGAAIVKATAVGGLTGPIKVPGVSDTSRFATTFGGRATVSAAEGAAGGTVEELYDLTPLPGADGTFNIENVVISAGTSVAGGELDHQLRNRLDLFPGTANPSANPAPTTPGAPNPSAGVSSAQATITPSPTQLPTSAPAPTVATAAPGPAVSTPAATVSPAPAAPSAGAPTGDLHGPGLIKGNADSNIYHPPGTQYYDATIPERMFMTVDEAEAAGFRAPR